MTFQDFPLHSSIQAGLQDLQFKNPTIIQEKSIPPALEGKDILGAAQTGTGKTGAFVIPILQRLIQNPGKGIKALILSPTRELATQIDEQIFAIGYHTGVTSATIIGGEDFSRQAGALREGVNILVATPGRLIDQMKVMDIRFEEIEVLVLDEADRMLDMGFFPDVTHIISKLPKNRQTLLFSATMPPEIMRLSKNMMNNPEKIEVAISKPATSVDQRAYFVESGEKIDVVKSLLKSIEWTSCIIFTATKKGTDELGRKLQKKNIETLTIHGDRTQDERNDALRRFKNGEVAVIVATDVLSRGIDIENVSIIINFDVPKSAEDYIHRVGRTGRYDKKGIAVTLVSKRESSLFRAIQEKAGDSLNIFHADALDIKAEAKKKKPKKETTAEKAKPKKTGKETVKKIVINGDSISIETVPKKNTLKKKEEALPIDKKQAKKTVKSLPDSLIIKKRNGNVIEVPVVEKARERNKNAGNPEKGIIGLLKTFIPKFFRN